MSDYTQSIALELKKLLSESGHSGNELAKAIGVSSSSVYSWMRGDTRMSANLVPDICDFFGIDIDEFYYGGDQLANEADELERSTRAAETSGRGFGRRLFDIRSQAGVQTRKQLSDGTGIDLATISEWEQGNGEPTLSEAAALADYLECPVDELAGRGTGIVEKRDPLKRTLLEAYDRCSPDLRERVVAIVSDYSKIHEADPDAGERESGL